MIVSELVQLFFREWQILGINNNQGLEML